MSKNIVLCFDGTGDWAGTDRTNVLQIFEALDLTDPGKQVAYYDGGVGTLVDSTKLTQASKLWSSLLDLGLGTSLRDKVLGGYDFLIQRYEPNDHIFLFGFSRGSYTARVLAGVIKVFGLLAKDHANLAPYIWQTYSRFKPGANFEAEAARVRQDFALKTELGDGNEVPIKFMGLFDTVSSIGVLVRFLTFPYTDNNDTIDAVRHAVSVDERRNVFPESLFDPEHKNLVEVWFPGVHRDVGGGSPSPFPGLPITGFPDRTLKWIVDECIASTQGGHVGEHMFDKLKLEQAECKFGFSKFDPYVAAGLYPMKMWDRVFQGFRTLWPNFKHTRFIPDNALIDGSVETWREKVDTEVTQVIDKDPLEVRLKSRKGVVVGCRLRFTGKNGTEASSVVTAISAPPADSVQPSEAAGAEMEATVTLEDHIALTDHARVSREPYEPINMPDHPVYYRSNRSDALQPTHYCAQIPVWSVADGLGVILGLAFVSIMILRIPSGAAAHAFVLPPWLDLSWPPLTESWQAGWDWLFGAACLLFVLIEASSGWINERFPKLKAQTESPLPYLIIMVAALILVVIAIRTHEWINVLTNLSSWFTLWISLVLGVLVWIFSQPANCSLRADRVLPLFASRWLGVAFTVTALSWCGPIMHSSIWIQANKGILWLLLTLVYAGVMGFFVQQSIREPAEKQGAASDSAKQTPQPDSVDSITSKRREYWRRLASLLRRPTTLSLAALGGIAVGAMGTNWAWNPTSAHQARFWVPPSQAIFFVGGVVYALLTIAAIISVVVDRLAMREYMEQTITVRLKPPADVLEKMKGKDALIPQLDAFARQLAQLANRVVADVGPDMTKQAIEKSFQGLAGKLKASSNGQIAFSCTAPKSTYLHVARFDAGDLVVEINTLRRQLGESLIVLGLLIRKAGWIPKDTQAIDKLFKRRDLRTLMSLRVLVRDDFNSFDVGDALMQRLNAMFAQMLEVEWEMDVLARRRTRARSSKPLLRKAS